MSFLTELRGWLGLDPDATTLATSVSRENPLFVYVKIPGNIEPLERASRFEDPIQEALHEAGLGDITGGGSQLSDPEPDGRRLVEFCGLDVDLYDVHAGLALLRSELRCLSAPPGTALLYEVDVIKNR